MSREVLILFALGGGLTLLLGLVYKLLQRLWLTTPIIALAAGIAVGPHGLGLVSAATVEDPVVIREVMEIVLAFSVLSAAAGLPAGFFGRFGRSVLVLLTVVMTLMWAVSAGLAWAVLGLGPLAALLIGAIVTPTDPVLATTVFTGSLAKEHVPDGLRRAVYTESGANDGLAVLFVMLPATLLVELGEHSAGHAVEHWASTYLLQEVLGGVALGAALGALGGWFQLVSLRRGLSEKSSVMPVLLGLTIVVIGLCRLLGLNDVLAAFAAGAAFNIIDHDEVEQEEDRVQGAIERALQPPAFVILGVALPFAAWREEGWTLAVFAVLILLLRRLPAVLLCRRLIQVLPTRRDAAFAGWFGPIGIAAVYYSAYLWEEHEQLAWTWPLITAVVVASTLAHGLTASPLTKMMTPHDPDPVTGRRPG